jgi:hypothetical protein
MPLFFLDKFGEVKLLPEEEVEALGGEVCVSEEFMSVLQRKIRPLHSIKEYTSQSRGDEQH